MNSNINRLAFALALLMSGSQLANAHGISNEPLGAPIGATDYHQIKCFNNGTGNASRLDIQIKDNSAGKAILSAQVKKGVLAANTTDLDGNDEFSTYSPLVFVTGGNGIYDVLVNKTAAGARFYDLSYHCKTKSGAHAGTTLSKKQNQ